MAGQDLELRVDLDNAKTSKVVASFFEIFTYRKDLAKDEIQKRKQDFKDLIGDYPAIFELTKEEFSVFEVIQNEENLHIVFDTSMLDEHYFSEMYSSILEISQSNPLLRFVDSSTGAVLFLGKLENKLEWVELSEPLKSDCIFVSGDIQYDSETLESLGASCLNEINNSVTLVVLGDNFEKNIEDQAIKNQIEKVNEEQLFERIEGWHATISRSKDHEEWLRKESLREESSKRDQSENAARQHSGATILEQMEELERRLRNPLWRVWYSVRGLIFRKFIK